MRVISPRTRTRPKASSRVRLSAADSSLTVYSGALPAATPGSEVAKRLFAPDLVIMLGYVLGALRPDAPMIQEGRPCAKQGANVWEGS